MTEPLGFATGQKVRYTPECFQKAQFFQTNPTRQEPPGVAKRAFISSRNGSTDSNPKRGSGDESLFREIEKPTAGGAQDRT